jgi:hypothetical protein
VDGPPEPELCARARAATLAFATGAARAPRELEPRCHLAECAACAEHYRATLAVASRLARGGRLARHERERRERRLRQRKLARAGARARGSRQRSARLRILLVPAFFIFLLVQLPALSREPAGARLFVLAGRVHAAGKLLEPRPEPVLLAPGEACALEPGARARLELASVRCELAGEARVWIEALEGARLRLWAGEMELEGRGTVVTAAALAQLDSGGARLRAGPEALEAECLAGELKLVSSLGTCELAPGQSGRIALAPR